MENNEQVCNSVPYCTGYVSVQIEFRNKQIKYFLIIFEKSHLSN